MHYVLGRRDRAEDTIRRALDLVEVLRRLRGKDHDGLQVDCLLKLGGYIEVPAHIQEVRAIYERVIPLAEAVAPREHDSPAALDLLAACHHTYAGALQPDHNDLAKDHYLKAIALREHPELLALPRMPYRLSQTVVNLGVIQWQEHAYVEAENSFRKGEELLKIARTSPVDSSREPLFSLGHLNVNWVGMLWEQQKYDQAVARANGAIDLIESYVRKEPNDALARDICLKLHGNRGHALEAQGKHKESAADSARVVELASEPAAASYRIVLAVELLQTGDLERAVAEAERAMGTPGLGAGELYNIGCVFSLAAAAANSDKLASREVRGAAQSSHTSRASRALRKAAGGGLFGDPAMRDQARTDADLQFVREHQEFRQIFDGAGR